MKKISLIGLMLVSFIVILMAGCGSKKMTDEKRISYMKRFYPVSNEYNEDDIKFHFTELYDNGTI